MGAGRNGNNQWEWEGNGNKTWLNLGMNHREWEGMGWEKTFPLISSVNLFGSNQYLCLLPFKLLTSHVREASDVHCWSCRFMCMLREVHM